MGHPKMALGKQKAREVENRESGSKKRGRKRWGWGLRAWG